MIAILLSLLLIIVFFIAIQTNLPDEEDDFCEEELLEDEFLADLLDEEDECS